MATAPSPNDLTRQQLDELDTLLQRMLTLPLDASDPADEPPPAAPSPAPTLSNFLGVTPPNWRVDAPAPVTGPVPHLLAPPLPPDLPRPAAPPPEPAVPVVERKPTPDPAPARKTTPAPAASPQLAAPSTPGLTAGARPEAARPNAARPDATRPNVAPPAATRPVPPAPPVSPALWPLVALDWVFVSSLGLFGPPGRLLGSGFGKSVLGCTGIGLLAYTAAHLATQKGWLTLPFPLPWPRRF